MRELSIIRRRIANLFDDGNIEALDQLYDELNQTIADLSIMRGILGKPKPEPTDPELEHLEMEPSRPACVKFDFTCGRETP